MFSTSQNDGWGREQYLLRSSNSAILGVTVDMFEVCLVCDIELVKVLFVDMRDLVLEEV
jgi:hypothetical protein